MCPLRMSRMFGLNNHLGQMTDSLAFLLCVIYKPFLLKFYPLYGVVNHPLVKI